MQDDDGLKTSIATANTIQTYDQLAQFNGVEGAAMFAGVGPARSLLISGTANPGSYVNGSTIVCTFQRGEAIDTETFTVDSTGGPFTFRGQKLFDRIISVVIGAQVNAGGAWKLGLADAGPAVGACFAGACLRAAGTLWARYREGEPLMDDGLPFAGERIEVLSGATRILGGSHASNITTVGVAISIYF